MNHMRESEAAGEVPLVLAGHRRTAGHLVPAALLVEPVGDLRPQRADEGVERGQLLGGPGAHDAGRGQAHRPILHFLRAVLRSARVSCASASGA